MIDIVHNRIIRGDNLSEPIKKWVVWWKSPFGYHETSQEAVEAVNAKKLDLDPDMVIVPVAVAIAANTHEVWDR